MLTTITPCTKSDCLQFMLDMNAKDLGALREWFNEESIVWVPPASPVMGQCRIIALLRAIFSRYSKLVWMVTEIFQLTSRRFIIYHLSDATFKNGTTYKNEIITDITFNDELKIVRLSDYFKNTAVLH